MKKYIVIACLSICCVLGLKAQNEDFKHNFSLGVGTNVFQLASYSAQLLPASVRNNATFHATPSFLINYDYAFNNRFSLGAGLGVTNGNANYQDAFQVLGKTISGAVRVSYTRIPVQWSHSMFVIIGKQCHENLEKTTRAVPSRPNIGAKEPDFA